MDVICSGSFRCWIIAAPPQPYVRGMLGRLTAAPQPWDAQLPHGGNSEHMLTVVDVAPKYSRL